MFKPTIGLLPQGGANWIAGVIYTHNLIRALNLLPKDIQPSLKFLVGRGRDTHLHQELGPLLPPISIYDYWACDDWKRKALAFYRSFRERRRCLSFEQLLEEQRIDVVFPLQEALPIRSRVRRIGWIPDFQHRRLPEFFSADEIRQRDESFRGLIREADHLVVSSRDAYDDLLRWFPCDRKKVSVFTFTTVAPQEWYAADPRSTVSAFTLPSKFLMFPSQFWAHKNHRVVFEAIRILKSRGLTDVTLVCTGRLEDYRRPEHPKNMQAYIHEHGLLSNIRLLGLIDRQQQVMLMRAAAAIVQPSLFEGWSSLVEDARTLGKKIYVSDIPVHREQDPPDAVFFNPHDAKALADILEKEWPNLKPGPSHEQERRAQEEHLERARAFGRGFVAIVTEFLYKS